MKMMKIYERETLQKTIYRNYTFKQIKQISIFYNGVERYGDFGFSTRVVKQEKTTKKLDK